MVKSRRHRSVLFNWGFGDAVNYPPTEYKGEASERSDNFVYKTAYFNAVCVEFFK